MSKSEKGNCDDGADSLIGSKRFSVLVYGALLSSLGATGVSLNTDDRDRYYRADAEKFEAKIFAALRTNEIESKERDTALKNDISVLRATLSDRAIIINKNSFRSERNETLIDKIEREIDAHIRGH